jgi:uncharacterized protein YjbI with pentapeptide repeats
MLKFRNLAIAFLLSSLSPATPMQAQNVEDLNQLLETKYCPSCRLDNADLSGLDLSGAVLAGASLIGADLSETNLERADLSNALLNAADLSNATLQFANLRNASLYGAHMNPAANFTGANLEGTVMPNGVVRERNED